MAEYCPFHDQPIEAANRATIRNELGEAFNSRYTELFEKFDPSIRELPTLAIGQYESDRTPTEMLIPGYSMGAYDQYTTGETSAAPEGTDFHPLMLPVSEYGKDETDALTQAGLLMADYIAERPTSPLSAHERMLVNRHTYYGVSQKYGDQSFLANMQQGVAFTLHGVASLVAEKIPGYPTLPDLLEGLGGAYTTEILTKLVGSLTVTPLVEQGFYVEGAVRPDLSIAPQMAAYATEARQRHRERVRAARKEAESILADIKDGLIDPDDVDMDNLRMLHQKGALGISCPAADRGGSVTMAVRSLGTLTRKILYQ